MSMIYLITSGDYPSIYGGGLVYMCYLGKMTSPYEWIIFLEKPLDCLKLNCIN